SYKQNGVEVSPVNAGSYDVTATVQDDNYQGSTTGTLAINKATATATLSDLTTSYDGSITSASATTAPAGLTVAFSYKQNGVEVSPVNAGSYDVTATVQD